MKKLLEKKKKINQKLEQEEEEVEGNDAAESLSDHDLLVQIQTVQFLLFPIQIPIFLSWALIFLDLQKWWFFFSFPTNQTVR